MANLSRRDALCIAHKGIRNRLMKQPLVISFETTLSCNCNCLHCDLGGIIKDEKRMAPHDYARLTALFHPVAVQISGGEPLLRKDITDIAHAIKHASYPIYLIFVTNGALLNEERYLKLQEAGVNQFSISLDYPDQRHDKFRQRPGLYAHLDETIPRLASLGSHDIILNSVITKTNLKDIISLAYKAKEWNVSISYSIYTPRRTGSREYCIDTAEDRKLLQNTIRELLELKKQINTITNLRGVFLDTLKFVEQGYYMKNCKAGTGFLVVDPAGNFIPCSLHRDKVYASQEEMRREFCAGNKCGDCYVSIRSYSEQSPRRWIADVPSYVKQFLNHPSASVVDDIPKELARDK